MFYSRRASELSPGINIFGYVFAEHGVGEEARLLVQIARHAELDFAVIPYMETFSRQAVPFTDLGAGEAVFDVNLICVNADAMPHFVEHFGSAILEGRYNIGMWAWEIDDFPQAMASSARFLDEVWGCSRFTANAIARSVPLPVFALPPPILIAAPPMFRREDLGLSEEDFLYLFCFDFNSIFDRKHALATIAAFRQAFSPGSGAQLLIKTINGDDFPFEMMRLDAAAVSHPNIKVIDGYLTSDAQRGLINACDAYISLHRAEGFGFTLAEAMALGKPVIATGYSGNLDFMTEENSYLVPYELVRVPARSGPYPKTSFWAEPDITIAASLMRRVFEHGDEAQRKGRQAQSDIVRCHSPQARAQFVRSRLGAIHEWSTPARRLPLREDGVPAYSVIGYDRHGSKPGFPGRKELDGDWQQQTHRSHRALVPGEHVREAQLPQICPQNVVANVSCGSLDGAKLDHDGNATVWGWAYDFTNNKPARAIVLMVNEQELPVRGSLGRNRPDVAARLDNPDLNVAGWMLSIPPDFLS